MDTSTDYEAATGLREWAQGLYPTEAATELLIRAGKAQPWRPWVFDCENTDPDRAHWHGIDFQAIPEHVSGMSGGERRLMLIAAAIGSHEVEVNLNDALPGLDRTNMTLVLAAMAHANGSHEHSVTRMVPMEFNDGHGGTVTLPTQVPVPDAGYAPPLFPWPEGGK